MAERLLVYQPHLLLFQWWQPFFGPAYRGIIRRFKKRSESPVFCLCHNVSGHERRMRIVEHALIGLVFRNVDGFLVQSETLVNQVRRFNSRAPVKRIDHPVYDFYSQWDSDEVQSDGNIVPRILFFGTIRKYKGLGTLLQALSLLKQEMEFRATIAGEFYIDPAPYRQMAENEGLSDWLTWNSRYVPNEEVSRLFRQADLVVLPYRDATQSGVVPLAYQFDVPVIASDVGGLSELVVDGKTGYLVSAGEAKVLGQKIAQYFRENRKPEFQRNILHFKRTLHWQRVVDSIVALWQLVRRQQ